MTPRVRGRCRGEGLELARGGLSPREVARRDERQPAPEEDFPHVHVAALGRDVVDRPERRLRIGQLAREELRDHDRPQDLAELALIGGRVSHPQCVGGDPGVATEDGALGGQVHQRSVVARRARDALALGHELSETFSGRHCHEVAGVHQRHGQDVRIEGRWGIDASAAIGLDGR